MDIVFVLDVSGSIKWERFPAIKDFVEKIMGQFQVGPNDNLFGVMYFSDDATVLYHLNQYNNLKDSVTVGLNNVFHANALNTFGTCLKPCVKSVSTL